MAENARPRSEPLDADVILALAEVPPEVYFVFISGGKIYMNPLLKLLDTTSHL